MNEIERFQCRKFGDLSLKESDISLLFTEYKESFRETFNLNQNQFSAIKKFKVERGGYLFLISNSKENLALFTISSGIYDFYELGDVMKLNMSLPRESFAKGLSLGSEFLLNKEGIDGIYAYPNKHAIALEIQAGYSKFCQYRRDISLIFFGIVINIPFFKIEDKLKFNKLFFKETFLRFDLPLDETRLSLFGLKIYKKTTGKNIRRIRLGFLYEFVPIDSPGDSVLTYKNNNFQLIHVAFENCDNSA